MNIPADYLDTERSAPHRYAAMKAYLLGEIDTVLSETWHEASEMRVARALRKILSDNDFEGLFGFDLLLLKDIEYVLTALVCLQDFLLSPEHHEFCGKDGVVEEAASDEEIALFRETVNEAVEMVSLIADDLRFNRPQQEE